MLYLVRELMQAGVRSQNFWCGGEMLPKLKWAKPSKWEKKIRAIVKIILWGGGGVFDRGQSGPDYGNVFCRVRAIK